MPPTTPGRDVALRRLTALISSLTEAVLVEDEERRISLTNGVFCAMFGIPAPPEALVGVDCSRAAEESKHHFSDPEQFVARVHELLAARAPVIGDRLEMRDGRVLERDYIPVFEEETYLGHLWKYRDITEQARAGERIAALQQFYERVLDAMPAQLAVFGPDGTYRYVSPSAIGDAEMRRWVIGKTDRDYVGRRGMDPAIGEARLARLLGAAARGEEVRFEESFPSRTTGELRHFARFITPVLDADGATELVLGYGLDITDRKRAEAQLIEASRRAEESARAKESFLANMSHEIRTPLNAVIGTSHLLESTPLDALQRRYVGAIRYSADTLLALINDILDLTKIGAGHLAFEAVPFRLPALVAAVADGLRAVVAQKGLALEVSDLGPVPEVVVGDPTRLNQVLLNLLGNAVKFTEQGSVSLGVRAHEGADGGLTLEFRVSDTGIGIAEDKRAAIFDAFTQERSDTTRRYGGTGLGLAIVRELVTRQGGDVAVESAVGRGSTFIVTLPSRRGEMPALPAAVAGNGVVDLAGVRVLLVEDNELNQFVATQILARAGAVVEVAENGRRALERLRDDRAFDIVLMDIQMPEMDGFAATQGIRQGLGIPARALPILALTASALVEQRERAVALGMDDFVMKPFEPTDLKRRIAGALWRVREGAAPAPGAGPGVGTRDGTAPPTAGTGGDAGTPDEAPLEDAVDLAILDAQTLGQPDFATEMIDVFVVHAPAQCDDIARAVAARDRAGVQAAAHKLKSAAAVMGATCLMRLLEALEDDAPSAPFVQLTEAAQGAEAEVGRVLRRLGALRASYGGQPS